MVLAFVIIFILMLLRTPKSSLEQSQSVILSKELWALQHTWPLNLPLDPVSLEKQ